MGKRILVIDDDPMIRVLVQSMLEAEGHTVTLAEDGEQGVAFAEKMDDTNRFDLVFLDVVMPGINGLDVLTRLRVHPKTQSLPVIMLTGEEKTDDILAGYNVGADYYITKPFTRQQLLYGLSLVLDGAES